MGTSVRLSPVSISSGGGSITAVGGTDKVAVITDDGDSTYDHADGTYTLFDLNVNGYTLAAGYAVKRVRTWLRCTIPGVPGEWCAAYWKTGFVKPSGGAAGPISSITDVYSAWTEVDVADGAVAANWSPATILELQDAGSSGTYGNWYEAGIYLDVIDQPTVTVNTPDTAVSEPSISWNYSDGDGDSQSAYQVKVFDAATYGGGGFDPDTSTPVWDSGTVSSSGGSTTIGTPLDNATSYRAYVKVGHAAGSGSTYWSAWAYAGWTTSFPVPSTPSVAGSWNNTTQAMDLTVTGAALTGGLTDQTFRVERSLDGGTTWEPVRDALALVPDGSYQATITDYEAPRTQDTKYRARAYALNGGSVVVSSWSSTDTETPNSDLKWWLKACLDSTLNLGTVKVAADPSTTIEESVGTFRPIGSAYAVVVAGDETGEDGAWTITAHGTTETAAVKALVKHQGVLLVQDPFGLERYVRVISRSRVGSGTPTNPRDTWTVSYVEVDRPEVT